MIRCSCSKWDRETDDAPHASQCPQAIERILRALFHGSRILPVDGRWLKIESGRDEPTDFGSMILSDNASLGAMQVQGWIAVNPPFLMLTDAGLQRAMRSEIDDARRRSKLGTLASVEKFEAGSYLIHCQPGNGSSYDLSCFTRLGDVPAAWVVCVGNFTERPCFLWHAEDDRSLARIKKVVKNTVDSVAIELLLRSTLPPPTGRSYQI